MTKDLLKSFKRKQRLHEKFSKREQLKMKLHIRSANIYLKKSRKKLKKPIISINQNFLKMALKTRKK